MSSNLAAIRFWLRGATSR